MSLRATLLLAFAACTNNSSSSPPDTVRDRLETGQTQLVVTAAESGGSITARRRSGEGWVTGSVELTVKSGELAIHAGPHGAIAIDRIAIDLGPIAVPESVFGHDAQLTDVHLEAQPPTGVVTAWTGDDEARATMQAELALAWSLTIEGKTSPLGAPRLPAVPLEIGLTGDGSAVRAGVRARAPGAFWSWADLVKLEDLNLFLTATTVNL